MSFHPGWQQLLRIIRPLLPFSFMQLLLPGD
jgi:hypothetical protein